MRVVTWLRTRRRSTAVVGSVLVLLVLLSVLTVSSARRGGARPRQPRARGRPGGRAGPGADGVPVTVVRRAAELEEAALDGDTTLVVTSPDQLGRGTARDLATRAGAAGAVVLARRGRSCCGPSTCP